MVDYRHSVVCVCFVLCALDYCVIGLFVSCFGLFALRCFVWCLLGCLRVVLVIYNGFVGLRFCAGAFSL